MKFYYFNSTHWDREWYQSFQQFRNYLCDTVEMLMTHLESGRLEKFIFDGQSIILRDVCEIHPGWRSRLQKLVAAGKLKIGPWYVMPDEFLVSPEALIRNLLAGRAEADDFGSAPWEIGYVCDIFGHIAQLPQILAGFGLRGAVVWRGFPSASSSRLCWEGVDGTEIPVLRLPVRNGYGNFTLNVRGWWDIPLSKTEFRERFQKWVDEVGTHFGDALVMSDAVDHCQASGQVPELLTWIRELYPEAEVVHSDLTDYFAAEFGPGQEMERVFGEQIEPAVAKNHTGNQISATLSSRYDVKSANDLAENRLELIWEPQLAERSACGEAGSSLDKLNYLWRHLLQNHAHDSICGCSIDTVHRQVLSRIEEVMQLGACLEEEFLLRDRERLLERDIRHFIHRFEEDTPLTSRSDVAEDGCYTVRIYNPLPFEITETREVELRFPAGNYPETQAEPFGYEYLNSFRIFSGEEEIPYSIISIRRNRQCRFYRFDGRLYDIYQVALPLSLPASGWCTLRIQPAKDVVRYWESMLDGQRCADNGILRLIIHSDGTFSVVDLRSNRNYDGLNDYSIDRDIGDGWNHVAPVGGAVVVGNTTAGIRLLHDGVNRVEFEITRCYKLPRRVVYKSESGRFNGIIESREEVNFSIVTRVAMTRGSDQLQLRTMIDNNLCDFRLRAVIPTGIAGKYFVSQSGAFLWREPGREHGDWSRNFLEPEHVGRNFDGIIGKTDSRGGIALLSVCGLHEAGALHNIQEPLIVTLMRAFRRTVLTDGEDDGELNRNLEWNYRLSFYAEPPEFNVLHRQMQIARTEFCSYLVPSGQIRKLPAEETFCRLSGGLSFSALKPAADGGERCVVLRLFNLSGREVEGSVWFRLPVRSAELCRLDETPIEQFAVENNEISLKATPWKMITVKVRFQHR